MFVPQKVVSVRHVKVIDIYMVSSSLTIAEMVPSGFVEAANQHHSAIVAHCACYAVVARYIGSMLALRLRRLNVPRADMPGSIARLT